jgi:hypothetical protein
MFVAPINITTLTTKHSVSTNNDGATTFSITILSKMGLFAKFSIVNLLC